MFQANLKTKFLLALALISALLTFATLLIVRHRVEIRVREQLSDGVSNSVLTFQRLEQQRASTLERSAALLASLPTLKALMTSEHVATIQDASAEFWQLVGSQLFVLADRSGSVVALHTATPGFAQSEAQEEMRKSLAKGELRDWWFGNGHLFEVFLQPIYFGSAAEGHQIGVLAVGYEIDKSVAEDVGRVAASRVTFRYGKTFVAGTISDEQQRDLSKLSERMEPRDTGHEEVQLGNETFLARTVSLSQEPSPEITLTVLKSFDEATEFLASLNRWVLGVGLAAVFVGSVLVFFVATTFTRPLNSLVEGVRALEKGDFSYPLEVKGKDEVSVVTSAFRGMRLTLQETQQRLIDSERLATIGRMASTISHDLRHPLTAILAYAEFLSEENLTESQRKDFYDEIHLAVNRMTDELNQLLGFSKQRSTLNPTSVPLSDVIEHAIQLVRTLPEFQHIVVRYKHDGEKIVWIDPSKMERVMLNLLFNACEAVSPDTGIIEVRSSATAEKIEIWVADNGSGIPDEIKDSLFQPFVSFGKEKGTGLGLTVVQKLTQDHGGEIYVESSGPSGATFRLVIPVLAPAESLSEIS